MSIISKIQNLINKSNEVTGLTASDLTTATKNLIDGYGAGSDNPVLYARSDESEAVNTHYHIFNELDMNNEYFEYDADALQFVCKKAFTAYILFYMTSLGFTYKGHGAFYVNGTNKINLQTSTGIQYLPAISYLKLDIHVGDTIYYGRSSSTGASAIGVKMYDYDKLRDGTDPNIPIWTVPESWYGR